MGFIESMNKGKFVVLCEIDPPKGLDTSKLFETTDQLKGRVDAMLVIDMPSAVMTLGSLSVSYLLKERGFDTIFNISCRDRNLLALQSDILNAGALGIENIYITEGDKITLGDHPGVKPVREIDADKLISVAKRLQEGYDFSGNELNASPVLNTGAFVNSNLTGSALDQEIKQMEEKINRGVSFFITPVTFDLKAFGGFIERVKGDYKIPIIAEIILLKSVATARYLNKHVEGVNVPDAYIDRLYSAGDKQMESIAITADLIRGLKGLCDGINIAALGWEAKIPAFLDAAGV